MPSDEVSLFVEQKVPRGVPMAYGKGGNVHGTSMLPDEFLEVEMCEDIDVVDDYWLVGGEESCGLF